MHGVRRRIDRNGGAASCVARARHRIRPPMTLEQQQPFLEVGFMLLSYDVVKWSGVILPLRMKSRRGG